MIATGIGRHLCFGLKAQNSKVREQWITLACSLVSHKQSQSDIQALIDSGFLRMLVDSMAVEKEHRIKLIARPVLMRTKMTFLENQTAYLDSMQEMRNQLMSIESKNVVEQDE